MLLTAGAAPDRDEAIKRLDAAWRSGSGLAKLAKIVEAQSGDPRVVDHPICSPIASGRGLAGPTRWLGCSHRRRGGRSHSRAAGAGRQRKDDSIDPTVGVVLHTKVGDQVRLGQSLATVHAASPTSARAARSRLLAAYSFAEEATAAPKPVRMILSSVSSSSSAGS